ncbi:MAG: hypothetical protein ACOYN2_03785 [Patescibacteria group bacterium]
MLVVIGIGGSNLGTIAVLDALQGKMRNSLGYTPVYFLDTVDPAATSDTFELLSRHIQAGQTIATAVISKSGSTTETIALFEALTTLLRSLDAYDPSKVVAITETGSKLSLLAQAEGFHELSHEPQVGGRYSVFSNVGIFPLLFAGVNVAELLEGATKALEENLVPESTAPALMAAVNIFEGWSLGRNIVDHFFFALGYENVGKWYRQLLAESVGKQFNRKGEEVRVGLTPMVSVGSTDLHSVGQLYFGGPFDKTFVVVETTEPEEIMLQKDVFPQELVTGIRGRSFGEIRTAIVAGTRGAFEKNDINPLWITLREGSTEDLGYLLQLKMLEVIYLGSLFGVNPFDQPNVEDYKSGTRAALLG